MSAGGIGEVTGDSTLTCNEYALLLWIRLSPPLWNQRTVCFSPGMSGVYVFSRLRFLRILCGLLRWLVGGALATGDGRAALEPDWRLS
jgi:hypothetical protein